MPTSHCVLSPNLRKNGAGSNGQERSLFAQDNCDWLCQRQISEGNAKGACCDAELPLSRSISNL
jgi:hypothetical protein